MSLPAVGFVIWAIYRRLRGAKADSTENGKVFGAIAVLFIWMYGGYIALAALGDLLNGHLRALPRLVAALVVLFPWPVLRALVLPLGLVRTAYYLSFLCTQRFEEDRRGGALMLGAWALLRTPAGGDAALRFLDRRLTRLQRLRGAAVVATALLAARRDELAVTRALLNTLTNLEPTACPALAYMLASEWLTVDAVARGDWPQIAVQNARRGPYLPLTRFLTVCAQRFLPEPPAAQDPAAAPGPAAPPRPNRAKPPSNLTLAWHWLLAPYHQVTWPLLQRARHSAAPSAADPPPAPTPPRSLTPDLHTAMGELVALLNVPSAALTEAQIVQVCHLWDATLHSPATHLQLAKRTLVLGQGDPDAALRELRTEVADLIGTRLQESSLPIGQLLAATKTADTATPIGAAAAQAVRSALLAEVEAAGAALSDRVAAKRALATLDEWREWAALLASYHRVCSLGGLAIRHLAWAALHAAVCNWGVWLWNERKEKVLANAIFRFLLSEAEELHDEARLPLYRKNAGTGV